MNMRQLTIFKTVCEELNFTKAGQKLYMTQPAISHVIGELEKETKCVLFDRISRKVYLTEAGKQLYEKVIHLLELYEDLTDHISVLEETAPLRIGSSITIANFWLPRFLLKLKKEQKQIQWKVEINIASQIEKKLIQNELDLALVEGIVRGKNLIKIPFSSYRMAAVCACGHPFACKKRISISEFLQEPILLREKGSAIRDTIDSAFLLHHVYLEPSWTSVNSQSLIYAVKEGLGMTILPELLVQEEVQKGNLAMLEIEEMELVNQNSILYHKDKFCSQNMKKLIEVIQKETDTE